MKEGIAGKGKHIYLDNYSYYRAKKIEIVNRNFNEDGSLKKDLKFQIDGEALTFDEKCTIEVVPGALDIIVDFEEMLISSNTIRTP